MFNILCYTNKNVYFSSNGDISGGGRMLATSSLIILGFILLILGADLLVRGSSNIAKRFHIPEMIIGLTIISIRNINA